MTNKLKVIGMITSVAGIVLNMVSSWLDDQKMEELAEEKVEAALAKREKKEEERPE